MSSVNTDTRIVANVSPQNYNGGGVWLEDDQDAYVVLNTAKYNDAGIVVFGEDTGHIVRGNLVTHNMAVGIALNGYIDEDDEGNSIIIMPSGNCIANNMAMANGGPDLAEDVYDGEGGFFVPPDAVCQNAWKRNWYVSGVGPPDCLGAPLYNRGTSGFGAKAKQPLDAEEPQ